jgi:hypothetical protein
MTRKPRRWGVPVLVVIVIAAAVGACGDRSSRGDPGSAGVPKSPRFQKPDDALFVDDFSKPDLAGWERDPDGVWRVENGMVRAQLPDKKHQRSMLRVGGPAWTDYAVDVDVCMTRGVDKGIAVRVNDDEGIGVDLRGPGYDDVLLQRGWSQLAKAEVRNANGRWHHLRVEVRGSRYRVFVNGKPLIDAEDFDRARGGIALAAYTGGHAKCTVYYDNLAVTKLGAGRKSPRGESRK